MKSISFADERAQKIQRSAAQQILKAMSNASTVEPEFGGLIDRLNESEGFADAARDGFKRQVHSQISPCKTNIVRNVKVQIHKRS